MGCSCGTCSCGGSGGDKNPRITVLGFNKDPAFEQSIKEEILDWMADPVSQDGDAVILALNANEDWSDQLMPLIKENKPLIVMCRGAEDSDLCAAVLEMLGLSLESTGNPERDSAQAVKHLMIRLEKGITPQSLLTSQALEKAYSVAQQKNAPAVLGKTLKILANYVDSAQSKIRKHR